MRVEISKLTKWALFMVFAMGVALPAFAENNNSTAMSLVTGVPAEADQNNNPIFTSFTLNRSTSLYDFHDGTRQDGMDYILKVILKLSKDYSLSVEGGYSQDLHDSSGDDFSDTILSLTHSAVDLGPYVQMNPSTSLIVPTSKKSHTIQNFEAGVRLGASFSLNPIVNPNLVAAFTLSLGQNFHQYDTDLNGDVLNKYTSRQGLILGYGMGAFSISGIFTHINAWTYQNSTKESFEHYEELDYALNNTISFAAGHTNSGSILKANGSDSNIAFINENTSMVYGSLTVMY